jgi:hypothetical protein
MGSAQCAGALFIGLIARPAGSPGEVAAVDGEFGAGDADVVVGGEEGDG